MKLLICNLMKFFPLLLMVAIINLWVDPAQIYHSDYEEKAAKILVSGQNAAGMRNYNERKLQEQIILHETECPETVVIGSSRVMTMDRRVIGAEGTFRNLGLSGAGICDYLGLMGIYCKEDKLPEKIVLGLDPWIFNINNGEGRYEYLSDYIAFFMRELKDDSQAEGHADKYTSNAEEMFQFLSFSYFQNSIEMIEKNPHDSLIRNKADFYVTSEINVDDMIRYADGSIEYDLQTRNKTAAQAKHEAMQFVAGPVYQLEDFDRMDDGYLEMFESMVSWLLQNHVDVTFYLSPFHPYVYEFFSKHKDYRMVEVTEKYFRNLAEANKIDVYGSFNPVLLKCSDEDFIDGLHLRRNSIHKAWIKICMEEEY